ncbi:hypothetical protein RFI_07867, partial [Reticulomyxa filosa]
SKRASQPKDKSKEKKKYFPLLSFLRVQSKSSHPDNGNKWQIKKKSKKNKGKDAGKKWTYVSKQQKFKVALWSNLNCCSSAQTTPKPMNVSTERATKNALHSKLKNNLCTLLSQHHWYNDNHSHNHHDNDNDHNTDSNSDIDTDTNMDTDTNTNVDTEADTGADIGGAVGD